MQNCDPFAISFLLKVGRGRFAHGAVTQVLRWVWLRVGTPGFQPRGLHKGSVVTKFGEFEALPPRCREWGPGGTPGSDKTPSTGTRPRMYRSGRLTPAAFCLSSKESRAVTSIRSSRPGATSPQVFGELAVMHNQFPNTSGKIRICKRAHREKGCVVPSAMHQQRHEHIRIGQHRVVSGVDFEVFAVEFFRGAALMRLGRIGAAATANYRRAWPGLAPEALQFDGLFHRRDRMQRKAGNRPGAQLGVESAKHPALGS